MTAIVSVEGVSKHFRVPLDQSTTLKYRMVHWRSASRYQEFRALDDVSFDMEPGQFLGIIGANGSGKSTLLKLLANILEPTLGKIVVGGPVSSFLELGVGFNPELTAAENIMLNGSILGLSRRELHDRMDGVLAFAELEHKRDQKVKNFSSGQEVRLAFAIAIQAEASILLMDEVLAVGDARFQQKCFDAFARYKRDGKTVILVTHDLGAVEFHCDRALLLDHGRIVKDGSAGDVVAHYRRMVGEQIDNENPSSGSSPTVGSDESWGSGEVRFGSIRLLDRMRVPHHTFATGEALHLEMEIDVNTPVDDLVCGFGISRGDGFPAAGTNTLIDGFAIECPPAGGSATIRYAIASLPLLGGTYRLTTALHSRTSNRTYDQRDVTIEFNVVDDSGRAGVFAIDGAWSVEMNRISAANPERQEAALRTKSRGA